MSRARPGAPLDDLRSEQSAFNVDDDRFDLFRAAVLIGRVEDPAVNVESVSRQVGDLAGRVRRRIEESHDPTWPAPLVALGAVMFDEEGFRGDEQSYDAPHNSFIHRVLERRRGLPITLSVLTCEVARRAGIEAYGIGFPGHFLVGVHAATPAGDRDLVVLDPFAGGKLRAAEDLREQLAKAAGRPVALGPEHLAPATPRAILERMLHNLRGSYARRRDPERLARVVSRLLILRPGHAGLLLERARARRVLLDDAGATVDAKRAYETGTEGQKEQAEALLGQLTAEATLVH